MQKWLSGIMLVTTKDSPFLDANKVASLKGSRTSINWVTQKMLQNCTNWWALKVLGIFTVFAEKMFNGLSQSLAFFNFLHNIGPMIHTNSVLFITECNNLLNLCCLFNLCYIFFGFAAQFLKEFFFMGKWLGKRG